MQSDSYLAVDWGSTHLRAWRIDRGICTARLIKPWGVTRLAGRTAESVFNQYLAPMRCEQSLAIYMAGMIGSERGWQVVDYLACPQPLNRLGQHLYRVTEQLWIVPGLKMADNVMRGEETLLLGAVQSDTRQCLILPGTHSKWVLTENAVVQRFSTALTGELRHLLLTHSLLGQGLPAQRESLAAFDAGGEQGQRQPALVASLFSVRANRLLGSLAPDQVSDYLSGLLIASEIATLRPQFADMPVTLVASNPLAARYRRLLARQGIASEELSAETAFLNGIKAIHHGQ